MRRDRVFLAAALAGAALGLAACQNFSLPGRSDTATAQSAPAGDNLVGEACRYETRKGVVGEPGAPSPVDILCGRAKRPSGGVVATFLPLTLADDVATRRATIE